VRVPVGGGEESFVLDNVVNNRWVMLKDGIAILNMDAQPLPRIEFYDFATGRRALDVLPRNIYGGGTAIAAPSDGKWLLFAIDLPRSVRLRSKPRFSAKLYPWPDSF
jgi:hypothetical protein